MIIHIFFIGLYLLFRDVISADYINYVYIVHCSIALVLGVTKGKEIISPLIVFYVSSIMTTLGNIDVINSVGSAKVIGYAYIVPRFVPEANLIWCIGNSVVFIGWELFNNLSYPKISFVLSKKNTDVFFKASVVVSLLLPYLFAQLFFLGSLTKLLVLSGIIGILFFARLWAKEDDLKYQRFALVLFGIQTWQAIMTSYLRSELIMPALVMFIGYLAGKGSIKVIASRRMMPFIIIFLAFANIFSTLGNYRANFSTALFDQYISSEGPPKPALFAETDDQEQLSMLDRSACIAQITNVVKLVDKNGLYGGEASAPILTALIPRFLWPEKPLIMLGSWFAVEIGAAYKERGALRANNSVNMTVPGELYLDWGWIGLVIGCIIYGGLLRMLWNAISFYSSEYNILGTIFGGYMLLFSFYGTGGDLQLLVTYASVYLVFLTLNHILPRIVKS